eukprot:5392657-Amphidinium_carterae.1
MFDTVEYSKSCAHVDMTCNPVQEYDVDAHIAAIMASTSHWQEYVVVGHSFGSLLGQVASVSPANYTCCSMHGSSHAHMAQCKELLVRDSTRCLGCISVATPASASLTEFYGQLCRNGLPSEGQRVTERTSMRTEVEE